MRIDHHQRRVKQIRANYGPVDRIQNIRKKTLKRGKYWVCSDKERNMFRCNVSFVDARDLIILESMSSPVWIDVIANIQASLSSHCRRWQKARNLVRSNFPAVSKRKGKIILLIRPHHLLQPLPMLNDPIPLVTCHQNTELPFHPRRSSSKQLRVSLLSQWIVHIHTVVFRQRWAVKNTFTRSKPVEAIDITSATSSKEDLRKIFHCRESWGKVSPSPPQWR